MGKVLLFIITNARSFARLFWEYRRIVVYSNLLIAGVKKRYPDWDRVIDKANQRRMWDYILIQTMWSAGFCMLRDARLKENELKAIVNLSALAPLYDDFFDKVEKPGERIHFLVNHPEQFEEGTSIEGIFSLFSANVKNNVVDVDLYLSEAEKVFEAQYKSKKLVSESSLDLDTIKSISFGKGAATVTCIGNMLNKPLTAQEVEIMQQLGALAQFLDDVFDYLDDYEEGRKTLINNSLSLAAVKTSFLGEFNKFKDLLKRSDYKTSQQSMFLFPVGILVGATLTCFDQYDRLEKKYGFLDLDNIPRDEMICDMDLAENRISALKNAAKFLKL